MAKSRYLEILDQMKDLYERKNAGYAGVGAEDPFRNFRASELFGVSAFKGCLVRMSDKWMRITNLVKNPASDKVNESILDTLLDLAVYCVIAICLWEEMIAKEKDNVQ